MKNKLIILLLFLAIFILGFSFFYKKDTNTNNKTDISKVVLIDENKLDVTYYEGNMIDEKISFGNVYNKIIKVKNNNSNKVNFAVTLDESVISNDQVTYNVLISKEKDDNYFEILSESILTNNIAYNLTVDENSELFIKIVISSNKENDISLIKGKFQVVKNLSKKDAFIVDINSIQNELLTKINNLNGINSKGVYYYEVNSKLKGYVIVDAKDISELQYYYFVHDNELAIYDVMYSNAIKNISNDPNIINSINLDDSCRKHSKNGCIDINTLTRNENGKSNFYSNVQKVINAIKETNTSKTGIIIYDVKTNISNDTDIRGYILADNNSDKPIYFLYLTNDLFMISGYNLTKNGEFTSDSTTIRSYNETAFKLSSENMNKVCSFSGYTECFNVNGEKV